LSDGAKVQIPVSHEEMRSAIMMVGKLVVADGVLGITEASAIQRIDDRVDHGAGLGIRSHATRADRVVVRGDSRSDRSREAIRIVGGG
jgi:hypothetical protein